MATVRTLPCLLALALAAAPAAHAATSLRTRGTIASLSQDGARVAVSVEHTLALCDRALVWNAVAGGFVQVSKGTPSTTCPANRANGGIGSIGLAGTRVAWTVAFGGNTELDGRLVAASTTAPRQEHAIASARSNPESGSGTTLGPVVGHGGLLLAARNQAGGTGSVLRVVGTQGTAAYAAGTAPLVPLATDGTRSAVRLADGSVLVLSATGATQQRLTPGVAVRAGAISGSTLALQVAGNRVQLWDVRSGRLTRTLQLVSGTAAGVDLQGGRLVYRTYLAVRVRSLSTDRDVVVATTPRGVVAAEIDDGGGLVYAYNVFETGYVRHLTFAQVDAKLK